MAFPLIPVLAVAAVALLVKKSMTDKEAMKQVASNDPSAKDAMGTLGGVKSDNAGAAGQVATGTAAADADLLKKILSPSSATKAYLASSDAPYVASILPGVYQMTDAGRLVLAKALSDWRASVYQKVAGGASYEFTKGSTGSLTFTSITMTADSATLMSRKLVDDFFNGLPYFALVNVPMADGPKVISDALATRDEVVVL